MEPKPRTVNITLEYQTNAKTGVDGVLTKTRFEERSVPKGFNREFYGRFPSGACFCFRRVIPNIQFIRTMRRLQKEPPAPELENQLSKQP